MIGEYKVSYLLKNGENSDGTYIINTNTSSCSCGCFSCTYLLPCKNIMTFRYKNNIESIIPFQDINERWSKNSFLKGQILTDTEASAVLQNECNLEVLVSNNNNKDMNNEFLGQESLKYKTSDKKYAAITELMMNIKYK